MSNIWMWSCCGEWYQGDGAKTKQEVIREAIIGNGLQEGELVFISEMKKINTPNFDYVVTAEMMIESANEYLSDNHPLEDPMIEPNKEQIAKLDHLMAVAWRKWLEENPSAVLQRYEAIEPVEHEITAQDVQLAGVI